MQAHIVEFNAEKGYILVQAKAWRNQTEIEPAGIDYAYGFIAAYNPNMKRWFVEDTTTSALMRVMALVMGGTEKATRETMEQVEKLSTKVATADVKADYDYWTTKHGDVPSYQTREQADEAGESSQDSAWVPDAVPSCHHGAMRWNQSKQEAAKSWGGYFCSEKIKEKQCTPRWYVLRSTGKWEPQV